MKFAILWGWQVNQERGIEPQLPGFDEDESTWEGLDRITTGADEGGSGQRTAER
jgi:hypothetical protein